MDDDQPKLRGSGVVVTLLCEYTRDPEANCPLLFFATDVTNVEKFLPSPGIKTETFCNLGRCSNH